MGLNQFTKSEGFFNYWEPLSSAEVSQFTSIRGRASALLNLFEILAILPLVFVGKLCKTFFSILGLGFSFVFVAVTLFGVSRARRFFIRRFSALAKDLADWLLWPIGVVFCLVRLILAVIVHPALYFRS